MGQSSADPFVVRRYLSAVAGFVMMGVAGKNHERDVIVYLNHFLKFIFLRDFVSFLCLCTAPSSADEL
jgi:hypothetical protein